MLRLRITCWILASNSMGIFGWLFGKADVVTTMPAIDAEALAKMTTDMSGHAVSELDIAGMLAGGQIGQPEHIEFTSGKPTVSGAGRQALKSLTAWIDSSQLYLVRGKVSPSKGARFLGDVPDTYFVQSIFKESYGGSPLGLDFAKKAKTALQATPVSEWEFLHEDKAYRQDKGEEFRVLSNLAVDACKHAGHGNFAKDIMQVHAIHAVLITCWVDNPELLGQSRDRVERIVRRKRGEDNLTDDQVVAML